MATSTCSYVFDLHSLHQGTATSVARWTKAVAKLLGSRHVIKTGYGIAGDLKRLAKTYPDTECYSNADRVAEVADLWQAVHGV